MNRGQEPEPEMSNPNPLSKRAQLTKMIRRKSGASIKAMQNKLDWQPHTIRAEISRLRKQGLDVTCVSSPKGPVYRVSVPEQTDG